MEGAWPGSRRPPMDESRRDAIVRLRGLPYRCTKEDVYDFFSGLAIAPNGLQFVYDGTGRLTGDAYVRFADINSLEPALERHMARIGHRYIEVFSSSEDEMERTIGRSRNSDGYGRGGGRAGPYSLLDSPIMGPDYGWGHGPPMDYGRSSGPIGRPGGVDPYMGDGSYRNEPDAYGRGRPASDDEWGLGHVVQMRGLPYDATANDIIEFFAPLKLLNVQIMADDRGRASGDACVEFPTHDDAVQAMKKDRQHIGKRYIELTLNSAPSSRSKWIGYERDRDIQGMGGGRPPIGSRDMAEMGSYPGGGMNPYSSDMWQMGARGSSDR